MIDPTAPRPPAARSGPRAAAYQRWRIAQKRAGLPLEIDAGPLREALAATKRAGIMQRRLIELTGVSDTNLARLTVHRAAVVYRSTAERLLEAMEKQLDARQRELDDLRYHLERLAAQLDPGIDNRTWPTDPLREVVRRRNLIVSRRLGATDRRYLYRSRTLSTERAEYLCFALGLLPEEVWGEWTGVKNPGTG